MRRGDREIKDTGEIREIIKKASICYVAMCKNKEPYIIPMNLGFNGQYIFMHSASEGQKIDILKENPSVCIGITEDPVSIQLSENVCRTGMKYRSVIIFGKVEFLSEKIEKIEALKCIIRNTYKDLIADKEDKLKYIGDNLEGLVVLKVIIDKITGKYSP